MFIWRIGAEAEAIALAAFALSATAAVKGHVHWFKGTAGAETVSYSVVTGHRAFIYNWRSKSVTRIGNYDAAKSNDTVQVGGSGTLPLFESPIYWRSRL